MDVKKLERFKSKALLNKKNRNDPRFHMIIGLLKAKGLLDTNLNIPALPNVRLDLHDVIWAGRVVEPRILEVLPAALIRFPKNFFNFEALPNEIKEIVRCIQEDRPGNNFEGLEFKKMKFWANAPLKDKRIKTLEDKKVSKIFRLKKDSIRKLQQQVCNGNFPNLTAALEDAISKM